MSISSQRLHLNVSVNLSVDDKTRHWLYFRSTPRSDEERQASVHAQDVGGATVTCNNIRIHNGRGIPDLTLDAASFELVEDCPTALSTADFYRIQKGEDEDIQTKYYNEVESFVQKRLKCDKVVCFHSQVRNAAMAGQEDSGGVQGYAGLAPHTDSSPVSADELALSMTADGKEEGAEKYERYLYLNLWRNISDDHPIENHHLAMLDERTVVKPDDYITKDLYGDGYHVVQYGLNARHASNHKWYYFPQMTKNEAILFKQMDSDWTKPGRVCFHMSVADDAAKTQHQRESIELRMMCFWKKADSGVNSMPTKENMNRNLVLDPLEVATRDASALVSSASTWSLVVALLGKIPLIGSLLTWLLGSPMGGAVAGAAVYSGNPSDYLDRFIQAADAFSMWPAFATTWVKGEMKRKGRKQGIETITRALVDDSMGYQKTKSFKSDEKQEIANFLLANEKYMAVAEKHWGSLANKD